MRIEVDCAVAKVVDATPDEMSWLCEYLTFRDPQARFHNGSPIVELVNRIDATFPSGYVAKVKKAAEARSLSNGLFSPLSVELVDVRRRPAAPVEADLSHLRDYQRDAVKAALTRTRGLIQMPTGSGKSIVAAGIISSVPCRWLVLVPQSDLLEQFAAHIRQRVGEEPGIIGDGQWQAGRVTVATFQTLARRMSKARDRRAFDFMSTVEGIIVDESHQCASGSFNFVLTQAKNAFYRIGISATPLDRSDKKSIFVLAQLGGIIHKTSSAELRAKGYLADATIQMVRLEQGSNAPTWPGVYGECVVRSKVRNALVVEMAKKAAKPALVFVNQVKQGQTLLAGCKKAGMRAEFVWGEDDTDERRKAIADLVAGRLDVIVCSNVFAQGVDIPSLASVVNGAGGQSVILTLQRLGRATRVTADKKAFECWDVLDDGNRHLAKHGKARLNVYEREGFSVNVTEATDLGVEMPDPRKDEHGFVLGSAQQAAHRTAQRQAALRDLVGVERLRNPHRGRILRPHEVMQGECIHCGAPKGNLSESCPGVRAGK